MAVSVFSAAKRLASQSGWSLSNLELQKILFLAHMFHLGRSGEPLILKNFEAWEYGPVHPDLYHKAKVFGSDPVENIFHSASDLPDGAEKDIIDEACISLSGAGAGRLVQATHRDGGAWDKNYIPKIRHCVIPNDDILLEYQDLENGETEKKQ